MFSKVTFVFALLIASAEGFSTGAQGCGAAGPAVGGAHLDPADGKVIELLPFDLKVSYGGKDVTAAKVANIPEETKIEIKVEGTNIKGCLLRLSHADGTDMSPFIAFGQNSKRANVCAAPAAGVTHTSAIEKPILSGFVTLPKKNDYVLDITVVYFNNDVSSKYTYEGFKINAGCDPVCPSGFFRALLCRIFGLFGTDPCVGI